MLNHLYHIIFFFIKIHVQKAEINIFVINKDDAS